MIGEPAYRHLPGVFLARAKNIILDFVTAFKQIVLLDACLPVDREYCQHCLRFDLFINSTFLLLYLPLLLQQMQSIEKSLLPISLRQFINSFLLSRKDTSS